MSGSNAGVQTLMKQKRHGMIYSLYCTCTRTIAVLDSIKVR